jgi:hypothetical protein
MSYDSSELESNGDGAIRHALGCICPPHRRFSSGSDRHMLWNIRMGRDRRCGAFSRGSSSSMCPTWWHAGDRHGDAWHSARPLAYERRDRAERVKAWATQSRKRRKKEKRKRQGYYGHFTDLLSAPNLKMNILFGLVSTSKFVMNQSVHQQIIKFCMSAS